MMSTEVGGSSTDIEKQPEPTNIPADPPYPLNTPDTRTPTTSWQTVKRWNNNFERFTGLETRGISRVPVSERHGVGPSSYLWIAMLWFSCDLTANSMTLAMLGPLVFRLNFVDSAVCSVFGAFIGSLGATYICTWGPRSGHRTMIVARWFMGYYPAKVTAVLTLTILLGYGTINCIITGQLLSAVNGAGLSIIPGIIIVSAVTLFVSVFGMKTFHVYERYAWLPQVLILFILIGSAGPKFNVRGSSIGDPATIRAHRLSFLSLCMSSPLAWTSCAADYFVYYPPNTPKRWIALATYLGNSLAFSFGYLLGAGLASGVSTNLAWETAYESSQGALILSGFSGLGTFGSICGVILALGPIADNIAATYSAGLVVQILDSRFLAKVPRWILTVLIVVAYTACALGGRNHLFDIFQNFLALMGYWTSFFLCIMLEEHFIFRKQRLQIGRFPTSAVPEEHDDGFKWDTWEDWRALPIGIAALMAFLVGWAGAVVGMQQAWYTGPIANLVGEDGCDLGLWVGAALTLIAYPVFRSAELKLLER